MNRKLTGTKLATFGLSVVIVGLIAVIPVRMRSSAPAASQEVADPSADNELVNKDSLKMLIKTFCDNQNVPYAFSEKNNQVTVLMTSFTAVHLLLGPDIENVLNRESKVYKITRTGNSLELVFNLKQKGAYAHVPLNVLYMLIRRKNNR